jgi:hypothetical protein
MTPATGSDRKVTTNPPRGPYPMVRDQRHGRGHLTLYLPGGWHHQTAWMNLFQAAPGAPVQAA